MLQYALFFRLILFFSITITTTLDAQVSVWKIGGSGLQWSQNDTTRLFVDFGSAPGSIQPIYFQADENAFQRIDNWTFWRDPSDRIFDYIDGEMPRMWKWNHGIPDPSEDGSRLIDDDSTTYNPPKADQLAKETFTMDVAVPIPAVAFGFISPANGYRNDGTPLENDFIPAYQVTASPVVEPPVLQGNVNPLSIVLADTDNNFSPRVRINLTRQYLRFFRYRRTISSLDEPRLVKVGPDTNPAFALIGSISEYQLFAQGVPQRAIYKTKIIDMGQSVNFGRLFWKATSFRMVDGQPVESPDARAQLRVEIRTGRDRDPAVYHGYMDTGLERVVTREFYENNLRTRFVRRTAADDLEERQPKPGLRASITYDADNWTFWSSPFTTSGELINLQSGAYLQVRITMESNSFDDFVRLDSLWVETAPLLAGNIQGEIARSDDLQPKSGSTEVSLGETTDFVYDLQADFSTVNATGFDLLRIRTGNKTELRSLQMGAPLADVMPAEVLDEGDGLLIRLPERINRANNPPIRLVFGTEIFEFAKTFQSEVLDSELDALPQPVVGGDVSEELSTNSLRVLGDASASPSFVQDLSFSSAVFTPNGDGIHDEMHATYSLFRLPEAVPVALDIYRLDGHRVARIEAGLQNSGPQQIRWDGRDGNGQLLAPGTYLATINPLADFVSETKFHPISIAY